MCACAYMYVWVSVCIMLLVQALTMGVLHMPGIAMNSGVSPNCLRVQKAKHLECVY